MAYELSSFVGDNIVGNSETVEFEVGAGLRLNSLSELVNSHQDMGEAPRHHPEITDHVDSPDRERPGDGYRLKCLR